MAQLMEFLIITISSWGYTGIFIMMAIESTVFPLPSELVIIPAGYLVQKGEMSAVGIIAAGTLGSIFGALLNYYCAMFVGRKFIKKYGRHFFIPAERLKQVERFFRLHGPLSTFSGRLIPVIRHLISIPAGLARMPVGRFIFYTGTGAGIWVAVLTALGYFLGHNEALIKQYLPLITIGIVILLVIVTITYIKIVRK